MATKITPPPPYSSVKKPVVFEISRDTATVAEVVVNGYLRQMPINTDRVNVAQYYVGDFKIEPDMQPFDSIFQVQYDMLELGRIVNASIMVDGVQSSSVPLTYTDKLMFSGSVMSSLKRRTIARGQFDEIVIYNLDSQVSFLHYDDGPELAYAKGGITRVRFRVPNDAPDRFALVLRNLVERELDRIEYQVVDEHSTRLGWINTYGAIDYYNFPFRIKSAAKFTKEKIYSQDGYTLTSAQAETMQTISTGPIAEREATALSQLLIAEKVWRIDALSVIPIDITSEGATIYDAEKLSSIQVEYRNKVKGYD